MRRFFLILVASLLLLSFSAPGGVSLSGTPPTPVSSYADDASTVEDMDILGDLLFVADGFGGLKIYNVSLAPAVELVSELELGNVLYVSVSGSRLVVLDGEGLKLLDVSDPSFPVVLSSTWTVGSSSLLFDGEHIFVGSYGSIYIYNVTSSGDIVSVSNLVTPGIANDFELSGELLFVANYAGGMTVYNVSDIESPFLVSSTAVGDQANHLSLSGEYVFVADTYSFGLSVVRYNGSLNYIGSFPVVDVRQQIPEDVVVSGDLVFVSTTSGHVFTFNISVPASPQQLSSFTLPRSGRLLVSGSVLVVSMSAEGISFLDMSSPSAPVELGRVDPVSDAYVDIVVSGDLVIVASLYDGVYIFNSSAGGLSLVSQISYVDLGGRRAISNIALSGSYLYVTNLAVLTVFDITDPSSPVYVADTSTQGIISDLSVESGVLYAVTVYGVEIFDVSSLPLISAVSLFADGSLSGGLGVSDGLLVVGRTYFRDILVLNVTDITSPVLVSTLDGFVLEDLSLVNRTLAVSSNNLGVQLYDLSVPSEPRSSYNFSAGFGVGDLFFDGEHVLAFTHFGLMVANLSAPLINS